MVKIISVMFITFFIFILSVKADEKVKGPIADLITNTTDEEFIKIAFAKKRYS
jgi:hypothetical protein